MAAFLPVRKERVQVHTEGGKPLFHKISVARSGLMLSKKPEISNNNNAPAWPVATVPWILWTRLIRALTFTACEQFVLTRTVPGSSRRRMRLCQCAHAHALASLSRYAITRCPTARVSLSLRHRRGGPIGLPVVPGGTARAT